MKNTIVKNSVFLILILLLVIGCDFKTTRSDMRINKSKVIAYNTEDYNKWEASKKIKIEEAFKIHFDYAKKNKGKIRLKNDNGYPLSYVYHDYYVFSTVMNIHKLGKFNLTGIWVNAITGEVKLVKIPPEENFSTNGHFWTAYVEELKKVNKPVYIYNTEEYNQKIKEFDVSIDKAVEIAINFLDDKEEKIQELTLDIVYDDFYIFKPSTVLYNHKRGQYFLSGIWVNGKTGDIIKEDTEKYVKITLKIPFTNLTRYNKTVKY